MTSASRSPATPVVLIVDDDDDIRFILRLLFEFDDFEVVEASSGPEAVARVLHAAPDFIVLDFQMPGMTGDKVAPVLRGLVPDARIVAFSAALDSKPKWADAVLVKDRLKDVTGVLTALLPAALTRVG